MAGQTLILPPSTTPHTELITMPRSGGWLGTVNVRISTHTADMTIHQWVYINVARNDNKIAHRRMAHPNGDANNWYNWPLKKEQEKGFWMMFMESIFKLTYTSANPVSVTYETTRSIVPINAIEPPATAWNKQADATPWTTNNAANNPTERFMPDGSRNALGVTYWVPR